MMSWPIFVPSNPAPAGTSASAKPIHKQLNAIGRGTIYQVPATSSLAALLAALAAAGEPAPSAAAPVWAHQEADGSLYRHAGAGWRVMATSVGADTPLGQLLRSAVSSIPSGGVWTQVTAWSSEPLGRKGGINLVGATLTVPSNGIYQLSGRVAFAASTSGARRGAAIYVAGSPATGGSNIVPPMAVGSTPVPLPTVHAALTAGQAVSLYVMQDSTAALDITDAVLTVAWERS